MFEWITSIIEKSGYLGIAFGMFMENIIPPIPSELVMLFSGATAVTGDLNIFIVILVGCVGSTIGLLPWYFAGSLFGKKRLKMFANKYGRILTFSAHDIEAADCWFKKHSHIIAIGSRAIPAIRTFIAIPAGIVKMDLKYFLLYSFIGSLIWDGLWGIIGYVVGENMIEYGHYLDNISYGVFAVIGIWYIYRVVTFKKYKV